MAISFGTNSDHPLHPGMERVAGRIGTFASVIEQKLNKSIRQTLSSVNRRITIYDSSTNHGNPAYPQRPHHHDALLLFFLYTEYLLYLLVADRHSLYSLLLVASRVERGLFFGKPGSLLYY